MKKSWRRSSIILLVLVVFSLSSCHPIPVETRPSIYYVTPVITYLKECPSYDCKAVGELYRAEQVERLEGEADWWRVQAKRSGLTGWIQSELLSPKPLTIDIFYVAANTLELRECPSPDCPFRKMLFLGERLQKIDENDQGWLRVLVEKDASIGWVPAAQLTDRAVKPAAQPRDEKSYLYAAAANVNLYYLPLFSSKIVKTVSLNEKLEKLVQHGKDWFKVRHLDSGAEGWVAAREIKASPVAKPLKRKRRHRRKAAPKPPEQAPLEPEAM